LSSESSRLKAVIATALILYLYVSPDHLPITGNWSTIKSSHAHTFIRTCSRCN